jgi:hypothetical protein
VFAPRIGTPNADAKPSSPSPDKALSAPSTRAARRLRLCGLQRSDHGLIRLGLVAATTEHVVDRAQISSRKLKITDAGQRALSGRR